MTLGEQIKQARENMNYSQEELATKLEVSRQAISKWENDTAIPNGINREMLNQILGLSLSLGEDESKKKTSIVAILGWVLAVIFAICFIISLVYIKTRLPLIDNNSNPTAELYKRELELVQQIKNLDASEIKDASVNIQIDKNDTCYAGVLLYCVDSISTDLEKQIYLLLENELAIDEENINIVVECDYLPSETIPNPDTSSIVENEDVTYIYDVVEYNYEVDEEDLENNN